MLVIGAAAAWGGGMIWPSVAPRAEARPNRMEIDLVAQRAGEVALYYGLWAGFGGPFRSAAALPVGPAEGTLTSVSFPVAAGRVVAWRLDTAVGQPIAVTLGEARLYDASGDLVATYGPDDYVGSSQVAEMRRGAEGRRVTVVPGNEAGGPVVFFRQDGPITLGDATAAGAMQAGRLMGRQAWVAGTLLGVLVTLAVVGWRRRRDPMPPVWLEGAGLVVTTVAVVFARRPEALVLPQFWSEDSVIFWAEQAAHGHWLGAQPFAGYLHLVPRLAAGLAKAWGDAALAPAIFGGVAWVMILWAVARVASRRVAMPWPYAGALAVVLVPAMDELLVNVTNAQWFGAVLLLAVALSEDAPEKRGVVGDVAALIVAGLSGPFVVLFLPVFGWAVWRRRSRQSVVVALGAGLVAGAQLATMLANRQATALGDARWWELVSIVGYRTGGEWLGIAPRILGDGVVGVVWPIGLALFVGWLAMWAWLPLRWGTAKSIDVRLPLLWAGLVILVGAFPRYAANPGALATGIWVQRYAHVAALATGWLLLGNFGRDLPWRRTLLAALVMLIFLGTRWSDFRLHAWPDFGWAEQVRAVAPGETARIPVNPPGWILEYHAPPD